MRTRLALSIACSLLALLGGCLVPAQPASSEQAIVGGVDSTAADDNVVLMLTPDPAEGANFYRQCTATIIAPNLLLTALHCISHETGTNFTCDSTGKITLGTGGTVGVDLAIDQALIFTGPKLPDTVTADTSAAKATQIIRDETATVFCNADVALVLLAADIPNAKLTPLRLDGVVSVNENVYAVGWGATFDGPIPANRQRRDDVQVSVVGPSTEETFGDSPGDREFRVTESICIGDSGGPVFDSITHAQIGVVSRGYSGNGNGPDCGGTSHTLARVGGFTDLIMKGFAAAGHTPIPESQPDMAIAPDLSSDGGMQGGCSVAAGRSTSALSSLLVILLLALRRRRAVC